MHSLRRNVILTEPLIESIWERGGTGITKVWQSVFGLPTSPWGISRFEAQVPTVPASFTLDSDSASLWSGLVNCTVDASGAAVVATPSAAGDIEVALDYADFDTKPWLFAAMAAEFRFNWDTANITSCSVVAEGWDGERVEIVPNADRNTWKSWSLEGTAVKFAGSWHQEFGRGLLPALDTGADVDADGISSATMADELRSTVFGLLPGRTCRRIVYIITPTTVADVEISFPSFRHTSHRFIPEIAQQGAFVSPNGPGVRWGQVTWWDRGGDVFADPPVASSPAAMPTILDGLIARRLFFEGTSATDGLNTEIASIYESGVEYTNTRKHMAVDPTDQGQSVHSFWVQGETSPVLGLVSSLREIPPDAAFPVRDRDTDYQPTTDWVQKTWCAHFRDRYYTSSKSPIRIFNGATQINVNDPLNVDGWQIYSHSAPVDNNEALFDIRKGGVDLAKLRPWHGSFAIIAASAGAGGISYDVGPGVRHAVALIQEADEGFRGTGTGTVHLGVVENSDLSGIDFVDTGIEAEACAIRWLRAGQGVLILYTCLGGNVERWTTNNEGTSWSGPIAIGSGTQVVGITGQNGNEYVYYVDSGTIKGQVFDAQGNVLVAEFTAVASGVDDAQIGGQAWFNSGGQFRVVLWYAATGVPTRVESVDGVTFV